MSQPPNPPMPPHQPGSGGHPAFGGQPVPPQQPPHQPPYPPPGYPAQPGYPAGQPGYPPPPQPGYPAVPQHGYAVPQQPGYPGQPGQPWGPPAQPPQVVKRIPEDWPYVVRPSLGKRLIQFGGLGLFVLLVISCPLGLAASGDSGALAGILPGFAFLLLLLVGLLGLQIYMLTSGGPVLAVGPDGLWVKSRPTRGQAVFLPWGGIERIYTRRWAFDKMVCVKPYDPRSNEGLGAFTAIDSAAQQLFFGTGFTAPLTFGDRPEAEVMGAIAQYAAGRVRIDPPR